MFTFVRVVVEPGVRTATVAWEAPAKTIAGVVYLLLSGDISIAGGVATAGIASADCGYLVLQQQVSVAAAAAAAVGVAAAEGVSGPRVRTEAIGAAR